MARIKALRKSSDLPVASGQAKEDLRELFELLLPGQANPEFKDSHVGWGMLAAQSPRFALHIARLTKFIAGDMAWSQRRDLRELAIQAVNFHFRCDFSFRSHLSYVEAAGLSGELLTAIPYWRTTPLFSEEQRLTIEYALAVVAGEVPDELFARVVDAFDETQAIELTAVIAHWSFWAMMLNATRP